MGVLWWYRGGVVAVLWYGCDVVVVVVLWWWCCGGGVLVVVLWWWCCSGGVVVVLWWRRGVLWRCCGSVVGTVGKNVLLMGEAVCEVMNNRVEMNSVVEGEER